MMWKHQTSRRMEACLPSPREKEGNLIIMRNMELDLLSMDKEQAHLPRTERRTLEPSSLGEVIWKPPWSHKARVQQGQGVMDKKDPTITGNTKTGRARGRERQ